MTKDVSNGTLNLQRSLIMKADMTTWVVSYLRVRRNDVDETDDWQQNDTDEPEDELFPQRERLHEAHLLSVPDARQMLLAVGMSDELQQQQHIISPPRRH